MGPRRGSVARRGRARRRRAAARGCVAGGMGHRLVPQTLLRLQRAVIVKAMPLRQHGASSVQCATIAAEIERRLPLLTAEYVHTYRLDMPTRSPPRDSLSFSLKSSTASFDLHFERI